MINKLFPLHVLGKHSKTDLVLEKNKKKKENTEEESGEEEGEERG